MSHHFTKQVQGRGRKVGGRVGVREGRWEEGKELFTWKLCLNQRQSL